MKTYIKLVWSAQSVAKRPNSYSVSFEGWLFLTGFLTPLSKSLLYFGDIHLNFLIFYLNTWLPFEGVKRFLILLVID